MGTNTTQLYEVDKETEANLDAATITEEELNDIHQLNLGFLSRSGSDIDLVTLNLEKLQK